MLPKCHGIAKLEWNRHFRSRMVPKTKNGSEKGYLVPIFKVIPSGAKGIYLTTVALRSGPTETMLMRHPVSASMKAM